MTSPRDILELARTDPAARLVLADRIADDDGETTVTRKLRMGELCCSRCECPETGVLMCRDRHGSWHVWNDCHTMNSDLGMDLFGDDNTSGSFFYPTVGKMELRREQHWSLLCELCRRSADAKRAAATRKANARAAAVAAHEAEPNLFSGVE